jgi:hypothetical protein
VNFPQKPIKAFFRVNISIWRLLPGRHLFQVLDQILKIPSIMSL